MPEKKNISILLKSLLVICCMAAGMISVYLICRNITFYFKAKRYQEKLAEQVGISVVYLSKIENGRVYPTLETLSNICTELDTELAEVLSNTEMERKDYANDRVLELFNACSVRVKPIALSLLEELAKL